MGLRWGVRALAVCAAAALFVVWVAAAGGAPAVAPTVSVASVSQPEGNANHNLLVSVSVTPGVHPAITVNYHTANVTATAGADYRAIASGVLVIPANAPFRNIPVLVYGDPVNEPDETFQVVLDTVSGGGATIGTGTGTETLQNDDSGPLCTQEGTIGNDTLTGTSGDDVLCGLAGNDRLVPGAGDDADIGGPGTDTLDFAPGAAGGVTVDLAAGTASGGGNDTLSGIEIVNGTAFADTLTGDGNNNSLYGAGGADNLNGAGANDQIRPGRGDDSVDGGAGVNTVSYEGVLSEGVTVDLAAGTATGAGTDTLTNIQNATGTSFDDTLIGDSGNNVLNGLGNSSVGDVCVGGGGSDTLLNCELLSLNHSPTDIALDNSSINENQPSGSHVGNLSTTDPDSGQTFTYTLVDGCGGGGFPDNASFQISSSELQSAASFNFEVKTTYTICVRTTDNGTPNKSFEEQFTITVDNVNEAPTDIALSNSSIQENQPAATTIGALSATDPDAGQTHTFSLEETGCGGGPFADNGSFSITGTQLKSAVSFNFEVKSSYTICVRVTDSGTPAESFDEQFTITITDVNDAPVAGTDSYSGVIGNTLAVLGTTGSNPKVTLTGNVLTFNDTDEDGDTVSAVAETVTSAGGGTATINTDGSFTFLPGPGDKNQTDTFTYHVTDGTATTAGTVQVGIANALVWYVNNAVSPATPDGRSSSPFTGLASLQGVSDPDGSGDIIFVYQGSSSYTGGLPLEASQKLLGEPNGLTVNNGSGDVNLVPAAGSNPVITNSAGNGVTLADGNTIQRVNISSSGSGGAAVAGSAINTLTIGSNMSLSTSGTGGNGLDLSGAASGAVDVAATIQNTIGKQVQIQGRSGGSTNLTGPIGGTGTGINLNSNTSATINLSGGVTLSTGASAAFTATNGGTVNVTGTSNTLATTSGTALNVTNATIGSSNLTFTSISAGTGSGTSGDGIMLDGTGTSGGLKVVGDGTNNRNGSGGTIQHKTGGDGSTTGGIGIYLHNTSGVDLRSMNLHDFDNFAIFGTGVNGFTLQGAQITGVNGSSIASPPIEGAVVFDSGSVAALTGTANITNSEIAGGFGRLLGVRTFGGTLTLNVTSSTIRDPNFATAQDDMLLEGDSNANITATIQGNTFSNHQGTAASGSGAPRAIQVIANNSATMNVTIGGPSGGNGNTFDTSFLHLDLDQNSSSQFTYLVQNNTFQYLSGWLGATSRAINLFTGSGSAGKMTGSILSNNINHAATPETAGAAIAISPTGNGPFVGNVTSNTITWPSLALVNATAGNGSSSSASMDVNIKTNTLNFQSLDVAADHTVVIGAGTNTGDTNNVCADIAGNTFTKTGAGSGQEIRVLLTFPGPHLRLPGYTGGATDTVAIGNFLKAQNTGAATAGGSVAGSGYGVTTPGGGPCATS